MREGLSGEVSGIEGAKIMSWIKKMGEALNLQDRKYGKVFIMYILFVIVMVLTVMNKENMHVDEIWSYTLSNNVGSIMMRFEEGRTYIPAEQMYLQSVAVNDASEQFNFASVWKNQTDDVHPPLYYMLLHIICSLNPGKFSIWYAAAINIVFALLTLYIFRKLMRCFVEDEIVTDISALLFLLSVGVLQNVSFFRMYVMAMFWVTLISYLFVRSLEEEFSWNRTIQICLAAIAGALTHYYCIIYLCATCVIFGICLILLKRWKELLVLIGNMVFAAGMSVKIFPAMLKHMFSGYRGTQTVDNLMKWTGFERWERLKSFYGFINTQMLGKIGSACIVFAVLILVVFVLTGREKGFVRFEWNKTAFMRWLIVGIPIGAFFLFVSETAVYVTDRYLFPIYAVTLCLFLALIAVIWKKLAEDKTVYLVMCLVGTVLITNGFGNAHWEYLYRSAGNQADYSGKNCICVYDSVRWKVQSTFYEVKNYKSATFISQEHTDSILQRADLFEDGFMLTVIGGNDENIINMILGSYPYLNRYEQVGAYTYSNTYFIHPGEDSLNVSIYNYDRSSALGADNIAPGGNVRLTQDTQRAWLIRKDNDHALVEFGGQVLDVPGAQYAEGTSIQLFPSNGSEAQIWRFIENEDGSFTLLARDEQYALTYGGDGSVSLSAYREGDAAQRWWIDK